MKEKQSAPITDGQRWTMQFYFGIVVLLSHSLALIHFSHRTTLRCIIFYSVSVVKNQDMCLHGYGIATVHCQCKVLFIYTFIIYPAK